MSRVVSSCRRAVSASVGSTMTPIRFVLVFLCALAGVVVGENECNMTALAGHLEQLLAEYERDTAPAAPVLVNLVLDVRHASLHDNEAMLRVLADLRMSWSEPRITWNVSEWRGCEFAVSDAERLWVPDVTCLNAAVSAASAESPRVRLTAAGSALWVTRLELRAPVTLDLAAWPQDHQHATLIFSSILHVTSEITLSIDNHKFVTIFENGKWEVVSVTASSTQAPEVGFPRSAVSWRVVVRRRSPAHAATAAAALAAALIIMIAAALLSPPDRPPLYAAAATTAVLWLSSALPLVSGGGEAVPWRMRAACAVCAGAALLCAGSALASWLARRTAPPADRLRNLVLTLTSMLKLSPLQSGEGVEVVAAWAAAARLLDLLMLLLLFIIILICIAFSL